MCVVEGVPEDHALGVLFQFRHDRGDYLLGLVDFKIERIHVGGEDADVACAEIGEQFRRVPKVRETEEGSFGLAERHADRTNALLDLFFRLSEWQLREVEM